MRKTNATTLPSQVLCASTEKGKGLRFGFRLEPERLVTPPAKSPSHNPPLSEHQTFVPPIRDEDFGKTNKKSYLCGNTVFIDQIWYC